MLESLARRKQRSGLGESDTNLPTGEPRRYQRHSLVEGGDSSITMWARGKGRELRNGTYELTFDL